MDIPKIIKEHHQAMIDKGFYDCPDCQGSGKFMNMKCYGDSPIEIEEDCSYCDGEGIDPNKNIGELLMLIVSELSEALEAHRNGKFTDKEDIGALSYNIGVYDSGIWVLSFESMIKDSFEDEIADVFLRLFDLCGYLEITSNEVIGIIKWRSENIADRLRQISRKVLAMNPDYIDNDFKTHLGFVFLHLDRFCESLNIPIEKHIYAKMAYNKSRPHKHGKEY